MDKIYSRNRRIYLPKFNMNNMNHKIKFFYDKGSKDNKNKRKALRVSVVLFVAIITATLIMKAISPIIDKQCFNMAKSVATKVSNEQATIVMSKYKYDDLCTITKDEKR